MIQSWYRFCCVIKNEYGVRKAGKIPAFLDLFFLPVFFFCYHYWRSWWHKMHFAYRLIFKCYAGSCKLKNIFYHTLFLLLFLHFSSNNIYTKMLIFGQNIMFFSQTCRLILFLQELSFGLYWSPCLTPHRNIRLQHKAFQCPRSDCFLVSEPDTYS